MYLCYLNGIPSIRYGGTGTGSSSGFQIVGAGDEVKLKIGQDGTLTTPKGTVSFSDASLKENIKRIVSDNSPMAISESDMSDVLANDPTAVGQEFIFGDEDGIC